MLSAKTRVGAFSFSRTPRLHSGDENKSLKSINRAELRYQAGMRLASSGLVALVISLSFSTAWAQPAPKTVKDAEEEAPPASESEAMAPAETVPPVDEVEGAKAAPEPAEAAPAPEPAPLPESKPLAVSEPSSAESSAREGESDSEDPEPEPDADPQDEPVESEELKLAASRTGFVFAPRLGLTVGGATHLGLECEESGDLGCGSFSVLDHKEASGFGISADALYGLIPELRLGGTLLWIPRAKGDANSEVRRLGTEVQLQAVAEGVFDLLDRLAVTVRVQGGGTVLKPTGFIDDVVKQAQDDCEMARDAGVDCTVHDGPYFAPVFGGGAGILVQTKSAARVRLDFLFQTQTMPIYEQKATSDGGTVEATVTMDQSRFWLLGGFEI